MIDWLLLSGVIAVSVMTQPASDDLPAAECTVLVDVDGRQLRRVVLDCPIDVPDAASLQAYADQAVADLDLPFNTRIRGAFEVTFAPRVAFKLGDEGWFLPGPVTLVRPNPEYPVSAAQYGVMGRCDMAGDINPNGRAEDVEIECQGFREDGEATRTRAFTRPSQRGFEQTLWIIPPTGEPACAQMNYSYSLAIGAPAAEARVQERLENAPLCASE